MSAEAGMGIGMFGTVISGMIGAHESAADRQMALRMNQDAIKAWLDVYVPDPESQKLILEKFVQTGRLTPELEQQAKQDASNFEQIRTDPRMKEAQLAALSKLEQIGGSGGLTLEDQSNIQRGLADIESQDRGRREALMNQYAARGLGGSGLELQAQMMAQQQATNRASQQQLDVLGSARQRALEAIMAGGELGGKMRSQEFGEQKDIAGARDAINRFNTQNMQDVSTRNVNRQNEANKYNLDRQQEIANANVELANKEQQYNKELIQQRFGNEAAVAAGRSGQYNNAAGGYNASANATANRWAGIGDAFGKAGTAYADYSSKNSSNTQPTANANQQQEYDDERKKLNDWKWGEQ